MVFDGQWRCFLYNLCKAYYQLQHPAYPCKSTLLINSVLEKQCFLAHSVVLIRHRNTLLAKKRSCYKTLLANRIFTQGHLTKNWEILASLLHSLKSIVLITECTTTNRRNRLWSIPMYVCWQCGKEYKHIRFRCRRHTFHTSSDPNRTSDVQTSRKAIDSKGSEVCQYEAADSSATSMCAEEGETNGKYWKHRCTKRMYELHSTCRHILMLFTPIIYIYNEVWRIMNIVTFKNNLLNSTNSLHAILQQVSRYVAKFQNY